MRGLIPRAVGRVAWLVADITGWFLVGMEEAILAHLPDVWITHAIWRCLYWPYHYAARFAFWWDDRHHLGNVTTWKGGTR